MAEAHRLSSCCSEGKLNTEHTRRFFGDRVNSGPQGRPDLFLRLADETMYNDPSLRTLTSFSNVTKPPHKSM